MGSETIREQLERILREHAILPPSEQEAKKLPQRLRSRKHRLKKSRETVKEKPC